MVLFATSNYASPAQKASLKVAGIGSKSNKQVGRGARAGDNAFHFYSRWPFENHLVCKLTVPQTLMLALPDFGRGCWTWAIRWREQGNDSTSRRLSAGLLRAAADAREQGEGAGVFPFAMRKTK